MVKFINLGLILLLSANHGIDTKDVYDPGCIQFTLENSADSSWESTKLRLVGKNEFHASYSPSPGETLQTQYCFNADSNKDGDVIIAGVYGLNSDNMGEISWSAKDADGTVYKGTYMTFMTFTFHLQGDLYWTTLKESHNLEYSEKSENEETNENENNSNENSQSGVSPMDYTESDADATPLSATSAATTNHTDEANTNNPTDNNNSNKYSNGDKWKLQGSISLCGYTEEMSKGQAELVSSVIVDTLNAASVAADVGSEDVSILFWESQASPNEISDSTISHKVIFTAYIDPVSFGYDTDKMDEDELARHIETYIQASIDSGMFMTELEDLALGSHVGSFCGIREAGIEKMASHHVVVSTQAVATAEEEAPPLYAEIVFYAIISSLVAIAALLVAITRRLVALKKSNTITTKDPVLELSNNSQDNLSSSIGDVKVETGTVHSLMSLDKERRFVRPASSTPTTPTTANIHSFMPSKKDNKAPNPYTIDFETTM